MGTPRAEFSGSSCHNMSYFQGYRRVHVHLVARGYRMCHALICYSRPREHNLITPTFTCYVSDVIRLGAFRNPARGRAPLGGGIPRSSCHNMSYFQGYHRVHVARGYRMCHAVSQVQTEVEVNDLSLYELPNQTCRYVWYHHRHLSRPILT